MELLQWSLLARAGEYLDENPKGNKENKNLIGHHTIERSEPNALNGKLMMKNQVEENLRRRVIVNPRAMRPSSATTVRPPKATQGTFLELLELYGLASFSFLSDLSLSLSSRRKAGRLIGQRAMVSDITTWRGKER